MRQKPATTPPSEEGGLVIELSDVPPAESVALHFFFGDLNLPMQKSGEGTYRAFLTARQFDGFPHQVNGFRQYRAEVIGRRGSEEIYSKPIVITLR